MRGEAYGQRSTHPLCVKRPLVSPRHGFHPAQAGHASLREVCVMVSLAHVCEWDAHVATATCPPSTPVPPNSAAVARVGAAGSFPPPATPRQLGDDHSQHAPLSGDLASG
jgi:hypothetical protein